MKRAAFLAVSGLLACSSPIVQKGPSETLRAYAEALQQGHADEAYRLLSEEAKRSMSLEAFRRAVQDNPEDAQEIARALARPAGDPVVSATVTMPNGEELELVYEGGKWRLDGAAVDLYGQATPRQALTGFLRAFDRGRYDVLMRYVPDAEKEGSAPAATEKTEPAPAAPASPAAASASSAAPASAAAAPASAAPASGSAAPASPASSAPRSPASPAAPASPAVASAAAGAPAADLAAGSPELTPAKLKKAWEGAQREQISRTVQAIKAALPTATIEETGDSAAMAYGGGGTVAFVREHGVWKIKDF